MIHKAVPLARRSGECFYLCELETKTKTVMYRHDATKAVFFWKHVTCNMCLSFINESSLKTLKRNDAATYERVVRFH